MHRWRTIQGIRRSRACSSLFARCPIGRSSIAPSNCPTETGFYIDNPTPGEYVHIVNATSSWGFDYAYERLDTEVEIASDLRAEEAQCGGGDIAPAADQLRDQFAGLANRLPEPLRGEFLGGVVALEILLPGPFLAALIVLPPHLWLVFRQRRHAKMPATSDRENLP